MGIRQILIAALMLCIFPSALIAQEAPVFITVDQFGYRPDAQKVAVLRDPQIGSDKAATYVPSATIQLIDATTGTAVFTAAPTSFNAGATDVASGDKIWWFDFSSITQAGSYYVFDATNNVKSFPFKIGESVYNDVLKAAVRMLFYQRAGFAKDAAFAGSDWADGASHVGPNQDANCKSFFAKTDVSTERDLHGAWYDAGDYNKYTSWTGNYVERLLSTYIENPEAFTDDYGIAESGNGIPDLIDEIKWGMDWLLRMQNEDGSVLSIVGLQGKSPPSTTTAASYYGPANTTATLSATKAFALGTMVFKALKMDAYSDVLRAAAIKGWAWAEAHPDSIFHNNAAENKSTGLGAGDQEEGADEARLENRMNTALYMYQLLGSPADLQIFEDNYTELPLTAWSSFMDQYRHSEHLMYLRYLKMDNVDKSIQSELKTKLNDAFVKSSDFAGAISKDGYRSFIKDYNWGSNQYKSNYGVTFALWASQNLDAGNSAKYKAAGEEYLHYIHGVNPFGTVYLTNMKSYGATKSITSIYHNWFEDGSKKWDYVSDSTAGPAPGYLAGGPNSSYKWDACCDNNSCGGAANNAICLSETLPVGEPAAKMYKDFNTSWPLNSWEITEPSDGYQVSYIRLLSHFVKKNGQPLALPQVKNTAKQAVQFTARFSGNNLLIWASKSVSTLSVFDVQQRRVLQQNNLSDNASLDASHLAPGVYFVKMTSGGSFATQSIVKTAR